MMPYDEFGTFYGAEETPNDAPSQADIDRMRLETQAMNRRALHNRSTPESYAKREQGLSLLPGETMVGGQSPMPKKAPISTATTLPQALMDRFGASTLPQVVMSNVTGYPAALAREMGFNEFADKIQYEPTSKYANDINEALGEIAAKTGPMAELFALGKHRKVTPSDVQVLGARGIETGRQIKRLPEDFRASRDYGLTRLGADDEPVLGARVQKGFESAGDYFARNEGKPTVTIGGMDLGSVMPDTKMYAVRNVNEGRIPVAKNVSPLGKKDYELAGDLNEARLQNMLQRFNPFDYESSNPDVLEKEYMARFIRQVAENNDQSNPIIHQHNLNDKFDEFYNEKIYELFPQINPAYANQSFESSFNPEQRKQFKAQALKEFIEQELGNKTYKVATDRSGATGDKEHKFPTLEEYAKRKEAVDILLNETLPNYYQRFLGTPSDPQLNLAKRGITLARPETLSQFNIDEPRLGTSKQRTRTNAGFNPMGETYPAFEEAKAKVDELTQLSGELNSQAQAKIQELIATIPQGSQLNQHPQYREYTQLANESRKVASQLEKAQISLYNARTALAYENAIDTSLEKMTKREFLNNTSTYEHPFYPDINALRDEESVIRGDFTDIKNDTQQGILINSLINDILNGEFPLTDTRQKIKVNGEKVDNPNYGVTDAANIRNVNLEQYIEKITKKRIEAEEKARKDLQDMSQKNMDFAKSFIDEYKLKYPEANNYGKVVPVKMDNINMTPEEIMQQASLVTWELDHCIGRGGTAPQSMKHHVTKEGRNYIPFQIPHSKTSFPGASSAVEGHIKRMIDGGENDVDFRDSITGLPVFTMQLVPIKTESRNIYANIANALESEVGDVISNRFRSDTNSYDIGEQIRVLNKLAIEYPDDAEFIKSLIPPTNDIKYRIEYFMGYRDRNTLKDSKKEYRQDVVKYLNDNADKIEGTSSYPEDNGIFDKKNHTIKDALSQTNIPKDYHDSLKTQDLPNRFYTEDDLQKLYEIEKTRREDSKSEKQRRTLELQNRLAYREFSNHLNQFYKMPIEAGNMSWDDPVQRTAIADVLRNPDMHYMGGQPLLGRDVSKMPLEVREHLANKIEAEGLHDGNYDSLPSGKARRVDLYYGKLEADKPMNYINAPSTNLKLANQILDNPKKFKLDKLPDDVLMAIVERVATDGFGVPATTEQIAQLTAVPRVLPADGLQDFVRGIRDEFSEDQRNAIDAVTREFANSTSISTYTQLGENIESYINLLRDKARQNENNGEAQGLFTMANALEARLDELVPRQEVLPVEAPRTATIPPNQLAEANRMDATDVINNRVQNAIENIRQNLPNLVNDFIYDTNLAAQADSPEAMVRMLRNFVEDETLNADYRGAMDNLAYQIEQGLARLPQAEQAQFERRLRTFINNGITETTNFSTQTGLEFAQEVDSLKNNVDSVGEMIDELNRRANDAENSEHDDVQTLGQAYRNLASNIEGLLNEYPQFDDLSRVIQGMEPEEPIQLPALQGQQLFDNTIRELSQHMHRVSNPTYIESIRTNRTAREELANDIRNMPAAYNLQNLTEAMRDSVAAHVEHFGLEEPQQQIVDVQQRQQLQADTNANQRLAMGDRANAILQQIPNHNGNRDAINNEITNILNNTTDAREAVRMAHDLSMTLVDADQRQYMDSIAQQWENILQEQPTPQAELRATPTAEQQMGLTWQQIVPQLAPENRAQAHEMYADAIAHAPNGTPAEVVFNLRQMQIPLATTIANFFEEEMNNRLLNTNRLNALNEGNTRVIEAGVGPEYEPLRDENDNALLDTVDRIAHWLTVDDGSDRRMFYQLVDELSAKDENTIMQELDEYINWVEENLRNEDEHELNDIDENGMDHVLHSLKQLKALLNGEYNVVEHESPRFRPPGFKKGGKVKKFADGGGSLAEKANRQINEEKEQGEPSTAWFSLTGGTEIPQNPNIPQGAMQMPPSMAMARLGHNIHGKHGRVNLGATGISVDTPQGKLNKLAGVDATYEHPSGVYARINKPTGGNMPPRFDIGYRKSFADGGAVNYNNYINSLLEKIRPIEELGKAEYPKFIKLPISNKVEGYHIPIDLELPIKQKQLTNVKSFGSGISPDFPKHIGGAYFWSHPEQAYAQRKMLIDNAKLDDSFKHELPILKFNLDHEQHKFLPDEDTGERNWRKSYHKGSFASFNPVNFSNLEAIYSGNPEKTIEQIKNMMKPISNRNMATSSDANVYPYTKDLNYYNELKSQAKADQNYQPYQEEIQKLEERNPTFKTYRRGGRVRMSEGGGLSDVGKAELAKIQEIIDNLPKRTPVQTNNERLERETVKLPYQPPKASSSVGLQPIPRGGSRIPSTQLELYKKTGGKVVSIAQMRAELKKRNK